jgi:hypothetical protein
MIAFDTNVLVYAHRGESPLHAASAAAVRASAEGRRMWAIPWPCIHEFLSVVTHPRIYSPPSTPEQAIEQVRSWCESPTLRLIGERDDHLDRLETLIVGSHIVGPKVHDARIAAVCLSHAVDALISVDRDFSRFPSLRIRHPAG